MNDSRVHVLIKALELTERGFRSGAKHTRNEPEEIYNALAALCTSIQEALHESLLDSTDSEARAQAVGMALDLSLIKTFLRLKASGRTFRTLEEAISTIFREERARLIHACEEYDEQ